MAHNKSPYEIRADLLKLAFEILRTKHAASDSKEKASPTTEEVIEEAKKLNEFISQSGGPRNR